MLSYTKLWLLMEKKEMKRTDLKKVISGNTIAKLGKNEPVSSTVIEKICDFLNCQPGDIMENITKQDIEKAGREWNKAINTTMEMLEATTGMSREELLKQVQQEIPAFIERLNSGNPDILGIEEKLNDTKGTTE